MKRLSIFCSMAAVAFGIFAQYSDPYKVTVPLSEDMNGEKATLINFDSGQPIDSVVVAAGTAVFKGTIDEPVPARIVLSQGRSPQFVLESGSIAMSNDGKRIFGSPLNDIFNAINDSAAVFAEAFQIAQTDEDKQAAYDGYMKYINGKMLENADNPVGYLLFLDLAYEMGPKELIDFIDKNPEMGKYERVKKLVEANRHKAATSVGAQYVDFDIKGQKLSDYVAKDGKYLLVDFFASWCGPCMRQLPVLKKIYNDYSDKVNVLGVAVWDEPEASLKAIESHQLPWPCIIDAGTVPTDLYGISGIPCIILIAPDGKIVVRDLQGEELVNAVAKEIGR